MAGVIRHPMACRRSYSKVISTINDAHEGNRPVAIFLVFISFLHAVAADEICRFPEFLQSYPAEGAIKPWTTRMWWLYLRHAPKWAEKQDIYVKNGQIWRYRENNLQSCENTHKKVYHKTNFGDCSERQLVYNRTCIHEAGFNTYRIIEYNADRTHRFTCMKFVERSSNVVQVYEGPLSNTNDPDLCDSAGLRLDEWPWTAPKNSEVSFCPFSGGFNFRTIRRLTNEDFCEEEWRRSRLDIECIKGDGMDFIAPRDSNCNPFLKQGDWKRLICWVGWEHEDYVFLIASDEGSQPRYCLRFPRVQDGEFSVLVYFSVICPVEHDGKPHHGIEYYELRMFRRDKSSCNDEDDDKCREIITSPEMCVKDTIYAPHCPKTCGQCDRTELDDDVDNITHADFIPQEMFCHQFSADSNWGSRPFVNIRLHGQWIRHKGIAMNAITDINHRRCLIEPTMYGDWRLIDTFGTADVTIDKDKAVFSHLGTFQCLDKDHKGRRYKMASLFDNGCSPRYTCMEFNRRNNNVLQYKLSRSRRDETTMDELCIFHDDLPPLLTTYRSVHFKNLILTNNLWPSYCGLQSSIPYNGTIRGLQCSGVISDWNEDKCNLLGTITLKSKTCQELNVPSEYQCIAFIQDDGVALQQLLLTMSLDNRHIYNCWVLTSYAGGGQVPWRVLYQLPTPQCSLTMEVDGFKARDYTAALSLDDRSRTKVCKPTETRQRHKPYNSKPKASDLPYAVPNQDAAADHETEVHVDSHPPKTLPSADPPFINDVNTDPPMWDIYGNGNIIIHGTLYQNAFFVALSLQIFNVSLWTILYR